MTEPEGTPNGIKCLNDLREAERKKIFLIKLGKKDKCF